MLQTVEIAKNTLAWKCHRLKKKSPTSVKLENMHKQMCLFIISPIAYILFIYCPAYSPVVALLGGLE